MFYQIGTMATKYRKDLKVTKDGDVQKSSVRGPSQVLACSAISVTCSLLHALYLGEEQPIGK
jgi:Predicted membrane protein